MAASHELAAIFYINLANRKNKCYNVEKTGGIL